MDNHIGEQLTLFAEDSHASPSQSQDSDKGRTMTVTSGLRCLELYESVSPAGSLARTFLGSSEWHSTMCALIWSAKATKSGRLYYQLVPSMLATDETEFGLWATPAASTGGGIPMDAEAKGWKWEGSYWRRPDGSKFQTQLIDQARMWPTPTVNGNYNAKGASQKSGDGLSTAVKKAGLFPTPTTWDYKGGRKAETLEAKGRLPTNSLPDLVNSQAGETGPLNPPFLEWLMGFPIGWTELKP